MSMDPPVRAGRLALLLTLVALLAVPTWSTSTAPGFAPGSHETHAHAPRAWADQVASLKFVPEDAAFYFSFQRCREQFEIVRASRSWRAVANMPSVKDLWQEFDKQWQGPEGDLARVRIFLEQKDNQQLLEVLADMVSHEVFFVGGSNWVDLVHILAEGYGAMALAPAMAMFENFGVAGPDDVNRAQMRALLTTLSEYSEDLTIPDLVVGFHLKGDQAAAEAQIRRLELLGGLLVSFVPELKDTLKRKKIGETNFLVFSLDFEKLPLGEIDLSEYEDEPDEFEDLIDRLKEMKLSIGLGVKDGCLVLVIGEELEETLEGLLEGPRLADSEHFKPVLPHLGKRVVSLSFISEEMGFGTGWSEDQVEEMVDSFESMLEEAPLSEEQRERLLKDVKQMFEDLAPFQATPGPGLAVSLLVEDGIESYAWDYGKYPGRLG
ncbi:MAG TPA: hypothetical protein PKD86_15260, partial [Gemmatales bacterium]|nr:hypothetical protein [Gemmatales bacterium]